jgi:hypothetical protein
MIESITNTCLKFAYEYGPWVAVGILGFIGLGVVLKVLAGILPRGNPEQGK